MHAGVGELATFDYKVTPVISTFEEFPVPVATITAAPVLPLMSGVVLPHMVVTIALDSDEARIAADAALATDQHLLLVPRIDGRYGSIGVLAKIETSGELPTGQRALVVRATERVRLGTGVTGPPSPGHVGGAALWLAVEAVTDGPVTPRVKELMREYRATVETLVERQQGGRVTLQLGGIDDPGTLADSINYWPDLSIERRVQVLETTDVESRLELVLSWVREALAELELKEKIRSEVAGGMEKQQRDFLLRQQLAAIRKELGEDEGAEQAVADYRTRIEASAMPDAVRAAALREADRLEKMGEQNPEQTWVRNWLDTVLELGWGRTTEDRTDVVAARAVLDADTTGLNDGKDRIIEWLAVRGLRATRSARAASAGSTGSDSAATDSDATVELIEPEGEILSTVPTVVAANVGSTRRGAGAIIALVGPPGVGKTSLGESVARALGRSFVRVALGGIRDEAEIRGHRRTYVGAQSGRIVRAMREAKTMNPVILLDEIDKLATGWSGDPAAALLEVLDPAQNHTFRDHYLEVDLDLSDVVFIATANTLESIPAPLLDRLEIIPVDGYTDDEKVAIARNHLIARQLEQNGLDTDDVEISDRAVRTIVEGYTREAGVRGLERQIAKVLRKVAVRIASDSAVRPLSIDSTEQVVDVLGRAKRSVEEITDRTNVPGVATGLAVTGAGGDVLFVEATSMPAPGTTDVALTVTGQLGDVMQESASIALSFVRANADRLGIKAEALQGRRIHVHFPSGAVPKDGPSAGITMTTALVSLLTGRAVRPIVAMTGEITLQGKILPIGGVKQKLLAAHRAGVKIVVVPKRNEVDLDDLPADIRSRLEIHALDDVIDVLELALEDTA